ncbi:Molybdopterin-guanine dinucleotide biosynthesis adapter protein [compost metagenome]
MTCTTRTDGKSDQKVIQIVGYKKSGKTTFISRLIPIFSGMNYKVAVIKHDVHGFDSDVEGTDTYKLRQAGAAATAITSPWRTAIMEERETPVLDLIHHFSSDYDLVILEGFKNEGYPKMVLVTSLEDIQLVKQLSHVIGIVHRNLNISELDSLRVLALELKLPLFEPGQIEDIATYVVTLN